MDKFSPDKVRPLFPALNQKIDGQNSVFFDGPGGSQVPQAVLDAITGYLSTSNSNLTASPFFAVRRTHEVVGQARESAAVLLNCDPQEIVFGANMTSLTAHISRSISREWKPGDEIIVTALDHYANVSFWQQAAREKGATCHMVRLHPEDCTLDYEYFESLLSDKTRLVAFTMASNVCGTLTDARRIIQAARSVGALTYVDAVHYVPHFMTDVRDLNCDFLVCSAYKFFGPHLGVLYGKKEHLTRLTPYKIEPAPEQIPDRWETGTKNFEALAGFSTSIDYISSLNKNKDLKSSLHSSYKEIYAHEKKWAEEFLGRCEAIPGLKVWGINDPQKLNRRAATFALTIKNYTPQEVSDHLARHHISAGAGHFYGMGVIEALDLADKGGILRVGALHYNTFEEMDRLFEILGQLR